MTEDEKLFKEASKIVPKPGTDDAEDEMDNAIWAINKVQEQSKNL